MKSKQNYWSDRVFIQNKRISANISLYMQIVMNLQAVQFYLRAKFACQKK